MIYVPKHFWYQFQGVKLRVSVPHERMQAYDRVMDAFREKGQDEHDTFVKALPVLKNVFYDLAKERYDGKKDE